MILWYLVFIQYVALSEALTTQTPNLWSGFDPFFGSWFDTTFGGAQAPNSNAVSAQGPGVGSVFTQENVPAERPIEPLTTPPTTPPTYETAPPTRPFLPTGPTEQSISLRELIRLAIGQNTGEQNQGIVSNIFGGVSKDTVAGPLDLKLTSKSPETTTLSNPKQPTRVQELATFPSTTKPTKASTPKVKVITTPATTTTTTTRATTTTTKPPTTTTTTKRPTTTTTTTPRIMLTTNKPIVKMTLGEILMLQSKQNAEANQVTVKTTTRRRGCFYKGSFYEPLKEIEKGQTGNWCYGTYCNHAGTVVHWDDHNCGTTATTTPVTEATKPAQPVTAQSGIPDILNSARAAGMNMVELSRFAEMMGISGMSNSAGTSGIGTSGIGTGGMGASGMGVNAGANNIGNTNSGIGCFHNGQLYAPGTDIENHRDYGRCYGSYCDYNSNIVQWNDRCTATVPPPTTMGGMGQMGMGMGGQMDLMNQMSMGGQTGTGMTMEQMALASHLGIEGLGSGGTGGMGMEGAGAGGMGGMGMGGAGGMGGMGMGGAGGMGMGGMGMGGQGGMGAQSQGGLSMRQLQQLDLI